MKLSTSILSIPDRELEEKISILNQADTDYIHMDVMDGVFVSNNTLSKLEPTWKWIMKPFDIHLMVEDVKKYVDLYQEYQPVYITFHQETDVDIPAMIDYIHKKGMKVGLAIKPHTEVTTLLPFLDQLDLVLVMSVEPGFGGQTFLESTLDRLNWLKKYRMEHQLSFVIEVDGGINQKTVSKVEPFADIIVSGSYIVNGNIEDNIAQLRI